MVIQKSLNLDIIKEIQVSKHKHVVRGEFVRVKHRHGIHHTQVEERSSKKHLRNEEVVRQSERELEDYYDRHSGIHDPQDVGDWLCGPDSYDLYEGSFEEYSSLLEHSEEYYRRLRNQLKEEATKYGIADCVKELK